MFNRLMNYVWPAPAPAQENFKPHPSWLDRNREQRESTARIMAAQNISIDARDVYGNTRVHNAIRDHQLNEMLALLAQGADIEARGNNGYTPLAVAVFVGNLEAARLLLARGARTDVLTTGSIQHTPLSLALRTGNEAMTRLLVASGANVDARESTTYTPLILAAGFRLHDMVGLLLQAGADPQLVAQDGYTAESVAAEHGDIDTVELLRGEATPMQTAVVPSPSPVCVTLDDEERDEEREAFFKDWIDPVSLEIMQNPVALSSGQTVDAATLQTMFAKTNGGEVRCPLTRDTLYPQEVNAKPNRLLMSILAAKQAEWAEKHRAQESVQPQVAKPEPLPDPQAEVRARRLQFFGDGARKSKMQRTGSASSLVLR